MRGHIVGDLVRSGKGRQRMTIEFDGNVGELWDELHDKAIDVSVKEFREKRSLSANAYFHVLVNQIAARLGETDPEPPTDDDVKRRLVLDYGTIDKDEAGNYVGAMLPDGVDVLKYYPYAKPYKTEWKNGRQYTCYIFYKRTSDLNSKEMSRLISGTVADAEALGIHTEPSEYIDKLIKAMERGKSNAEPHHKGVDQT